MYCFGTLITCHLIPIQFQLVGTFGMRPKIARIFFRKKLYSIVYTSKWCQPFIKGYQKPILEFQNFFRRQLKCFRKRSRGRKFKIINRLVKERKQKEKLNKHVKDKKKTNMVSGLIVEERNDFRDIDFRDEDCRHEDFRDEEDFRDQEDFRDHEEDLRYHEENFRHHEEDLRYHKFS